MIYNALVKKINGINGIGFFEVVKNLENIKIPKKRGFGRNYKNCFLYFY